MASGGLNGAAAGLGNVAKTGAQAVGQKAAAGVRAFGQRTTAAFRADEAGPATERPSKPIDVAVVVEALARRHGVPAATLAATAQSNLRSLLEQSE